MPMVPAKRHFGKGGLNKAIGNELKALEGKLFLVIERLRRIELTEIILHFVAMETRLAFRKFSDKTERNGG